MIKSRRFPLDKLYFELCPHPQSPVCCMFCTRSEYLLTRSLSVKTPRRACNQCSFVEVIRINNKSCLYEFWQIGEPLLSEIHAIPREKHTRDCMLKLWLKWNAIIILSRISACFVCLPKNLQVFKSVLLQYVTTRDFILHLSCHRVVLHTQEVPSIS